KKNSHLFRDNTMFRTCTCMKNYITLDLISTSAYQRNCKEGEQNESSLSAKKFYRCRQTYCPAHTWSGKDAGLDDATNDEAYRQRDRAQQRYGVSLAGRTNAAQT